MVAVAKEKLPNYNFSLPEVIAEEFRRIGDVHGERNKLRWAVASAAVLKLLELPDDEMHALIQRVAGARHYADTLAKMVAEAKAKAGEGGRNKANIRGGEDEPLPKIRGTITKGGKTTRVE